MKQQLIKFLSHELPSPNVSPEVAVTLADQILQKLSEFPENPDADSVSAFFWEIADILHTAFAPLPREESRFGPMLMPDGKSFVLLDFNPLANNNLPAVMLWLFKASKKEFALVNCWGENRFALTVH